MHVDLREALLQAAQQIFVPLDLQIGVQSALQTVVRLLVGAGAISSSYSVAPLFSQTETTRYNALLKEVPQT